MFDSFELPALNPAHFLKENYRFTLHLHGSLCYVKEYMISIHPSTDTHIKQAFHPTICALILLFKILFFMLRTQKSIKSTSKHLFLNDFCTSTL